ncbi:MATE family efflux transporter [Marinimicrobium sp. LS-A18]|uniref:MATE family efflux transporter n=1 Tax=Marinimicrobium sp. LS-A18 TaxID=1381596 RepID=UPI000466954C|nr:MATE family efflux transporter [Marinimicrobium sp. LS-A18]
MTDTRPNHRQIWQLAWPMMLSNLSIPLLGAVDTAILGHLGSPVYLGAVSLGASVLTLLFWSFGFLRMGTTSVAARATGAEDHDAIRLVLAQSLILALGLALPIIALGPWLIPTALGWMGASPEVAALAQSYGQIRLWGAPASLMNFALIGWFIGRQDTRRPLMILLSTNLLNILLDALLILGLGMKSDGAAWASVLAEYGGLLVGLGLLRHHLRRLPGQLDRLHLRQWHAYRALLQVNRHLFVRTLCLLLVFAFFAAQGARLGDQILAANAVLLQFLMLTSYALDGFAHAAEALAGRAVGARQADALRQTVRLTTLWALACAALISLVFIAGAPWWPGLFTSLEPVLEQVRAHYLWICLVPLVGVWGYQLDGVYLGSGRTAIMQYSVVGSALVVFLPLWWWLQPLGNHGLWLAFLAFNGARGISLGAVYYYLNRRRRWLLPA